MNVWQSRSFNLTLRDVCVPCNTRWMSQLENTAKPILQRMVRAKRVVLDERSQRIVARWAGKTAMVMDRLGKGNSRSL